MKENHVSSSVINDQNMRILNKILGNEIEQSFLKECKMFHNAIQNMQHPSLSVDPSFCKFLV